MLFVHRVSFEEHFGPIPRGAMVLHNCDNPCCMNPMHLRLGTGVDNANDMYERGGRARTLTPQQAEQIRIRSRGGEKQRLLAKEFGVSQSLVSMICRERVYQEHK